MSTIFTICDGTRKDEHMNLLSAVTATMATMAIREQEIFYKKKYDNEFLIARKYLEKLNSWPSIASDDMITIEDFSLYLVTCQNLMRNVLVLIS